MFFKNLLFSIILISGFFLTAELVLALAGVRPLLLSEDPLVGFADTVPQFIKANRADGAEMYAQRFPDQPYASALAGDGKVYVQTRYGGTYVLAAKPQFEQLAHNQLDDKSTFNASPIVANGNLYLRSDRHLYCIAN